MEPIKKLNQTAIKQNIIIRLGHVEPSKHANYIKLLNEWLNNVNNRVARYAYIYHDKDILTSINDYGEVEKKPKKPHIHLYIEYETNSKIRLSTTLNRIGTYLNLVLDSIVIEPIKNDIGALQYLIHKNDKDKYQYPISDIVHNFDTTELETILSLEGKELTAKSLRLIVINCKGNKWLIMNEIGLAYYKNYRGVISDLVDCYFNRELAIANKEELNK